MTRGFLGSSKKEPADSCTIRKSTREVSIDTFQATSIDSVNQKSIDNITTPSIHITCEKAGKVEGTEIPDDSAVAEEDDFDLKPIYIALMEHHPFHGFPHEQAIDHINMIEELVLFIFNDHYFCKLFPYTITGDATHWFKMLTPRSLTTWNDMRDAFLNKFLYDNAANLEIEMESLRRYVVEDNEQHVSRELSIVEEAGTEGTTSTSTYDTISTSTDGRTSTSSNGRTSTSTDGTISTSTDGTISTSIDRTTSISTNITTPTSTDGTTSTSTDGTTSTSTDGTTSTSTDATTLTSIDSMNSETIDRTSAAINTDFCHRSIPLEIPERLSCPQDIADSTHNSTDVSSCSPSPDVDR
ncbi:serine-rich adhesin for platelets-like [Brassica rapa]|uniref:serine-rich adhesin for platelets-like n=1 Tax=Brassica campestris TaxID=3711 RepID=UPI00142D34A4|nr:serine-rich adhesin for platelets-like [Brassica rapa]